MDPLRISLMRTAIVHYWLVRMRGGEGVIKSLIDIHSDADVITNVYKAEGVKELFEHRVAPITTRINRLPFAAQLYPIYMPLMPAALEQIDMSPYDLVISSEAGPSKWVIPAPHARHVCYVHSPMRYLWDQRLVYRAKVPALARPLFDNITRRLRLEDFASAGRVDDFVANSSFVAARIKQYYRRNSTVIHPPVEVDDFGAPLPAEDFYLFVGQLVSYKNARHAVEACVKLGRKLVVVGDGPDRKYVEQFAGNGVEYRGHLPREALVDLMRRCRALLFPGLEDFGIVPVEVLAAGRPVIAFGRGGIVDTVNHGSTGILYDTMGVDELVRAIEAFEEWHPDFNAAVAQENAQAFNPATFQVKWRNFIGL